MKKSELEKIVSTKAGCTMVEAGAMIENVVGAIMEGAKANGECPIPNLGKLKLVNVPAKTGKIPGSDKTYSKDAYNTYKFAISKAGKEAADA